MNNPLHNELKKEFQLERMILFSDAVFAIAITLLVIELKIPEISLNELTDHKLFESLVELLPRIIGFLVSFFLIGLYWTIHHRIFGFVVNYDQKLLWLNLFFLLAVVLMPFSSGFYSAYIFKLLKAPLIIYVTNVCFLSLMNMLLWRYISNPKHKLSEGIQPEFAQYFLTRAGIVTVGFFCMGLVYLFAPKFGVFVPLMIPVLMIIAKRRFILSSKQAQSV
ncbi:TMEM175 family protein [Solitalea sp. MAHUQ-68]|uniref:TMEM175 family protein n=1 Tax=Solitalea agri TaxID=2953739 RepID=A0A9X2F1S2_9SPHI|nr:TMEM175 family protein [Solitalea agri]MCO4292626.1 TMEM175 family protein [Solitalea agri]